MQLGFGATPVVSRRPMIDVIGPYVATVPIPQSASRSAHGVVHWPTKTLPKPPCRPTAELREAKLDVCAMLFERSMDALVSTCAHAVRPPPRLSRARTPTFEACDATSHFDTDGTPPVPSSYFILFSDM